ncbi:hypothetical protein HYY69_04010 [Candidatus Woesearchaeota archaeon]|nr:hypothetical protein [Candidatus Woesearchaeota archaeon]
MNDSELSDLITDIGERVFEPDQGMVINIYLQGDISEAIRQVLSLSSAKIIEEIKRVSPRLPLKPDGFSFSRDGSFNSIIVAVTESCKIHYHTLFATRTRIVPDELTGETHLTYQMALPDRMWGIFYLGVLLSDEKLKERIDHVTYRVTPAFALPRADRKPFDINDPENKIGMVKHFIEYEHPGEDVVTALRNKGWVLYEAESPFTNHIHTEEPVALIRNGRYYAILPFDAQVDSQRGFFTGERQYPTLEGEDGQKIMIQGIHCKEGLVYASTTEMRQERADQRVHVMTLGFPLFRLPTNIERGFSQYKPRSREVQ